MICPICGESTRRFGFNRNGSQRYRCDECRKTFTDEATSHDGRRLPHEKLVFCLRLFFEGNSVRSIERLTGVHRDTFLVAMVTTGERCERFLEAAIAGVPVNDVEADEIWSFVGCKEKTAVAKGYGPEVGDCYTFTAIERTTKLVLTYHVGKRDPFHTQVFAEKLSNATSGRFQLTTDGYRPYLTAIPEALGGRVDYATLVKVYGDATEEEKRRYSPGRIIEIKSTIQTGNPDREFICTSFVERSNKTLRMQIRRLTRLTDAHSKKWENHGAAISLFIAYYNFCRKHSTIKTTPAVAAGLTSEPWTVERLLEAVSPA
jgi:transposase-like protein/IS1 family transposase